MGRDPIYESAAVALGKELVRRGLGLVYGGGSVGLMGVIADAVMTDGGEVVGVITKQLVALEVAHKGLADLKVVDSMHERKALMAELSDGFIALPGGFGTMDEFCEIVTWAQLGIHAKPCGLLNINGYFDAFLTYVDHCVGQGFIRKEHRSLFYEAEHPAELLDVFSRHKPSSAALKWMGGRAPKP
jgi:uncharacterized protein (TIGR00730 family)